jgi:uncharacterized protein
VTIYGIAFPFSKGVSQFPQSAIDDAAIQASIIQILMTPKGARLFRPTLGCDLLKFLFEANSDATVAGVEREINTALTKWEPRIFVNNVDIDTADVTQPGQLIITVTYTIKANNTTSSVTIGT